MLRRLVLVVPVAGLAVLGGLALTRARDDQPVPIAQAPPSSTTTADLAESAPAAPTTSTTTTIPATTTSTTLPPARFVDLRTVGRPWGTVEGLLQFRGNPTHTFYGTGPVPRQPVVRWRFPDDPMCGSSSVGGETTVWCGTGWTGQPVVWERPDGITEVIFGAYDKAVHFLDGATGERTRPDFRVGDIIKGSVTLDPDGFPILYFGSRDNRLRAIALDRETPVELWSLDASAVNGIWNNDWDGNPSVVDDFLFVGGENSYFFVVRLNRHLDGEGLVAVDPEIVVAMPGWTDELIQRVGRNVSIESSVAVADGRAYFTNSGGRVVGIDLTDIDDGLAPVVFDFWAGDDIDATPVVDADGMLYVAVELERFLPRAGEVGQLIKLDPHRPDDPLVWSIAVPPAVAGTDGGLWATPALGDGVLYAATHPGELLVVDTEIGEVVWRTDIGFHAWSSPVLVDDMLIVATDCEAGGALRAFSVADPRNPIDAWTLPHGSGCIESTPAVWNGTIYVGSRDGFFYAIGDGE